MLRIKAFFGTTENAVKTQIWTAIATYVLIAIVKKHFELESFFVRDYASNGPKYV